MSKILRRHVAGMLPLIAMTTLMQQSGEPTIELPDVSGYPPRPECYGHHLSKSQRKGKTWQEIQAMRTRLAAGEPQA